MTSISRLLASSALLALMGLSTVQAEPFTPEQKTEMQQIIRAYLLENPELLRDMADRKSVV